MKKIFKISKKILRFIKNNNHMCVCKFSTVCPCEDFLKRSNCTCGLYTEVKNVKRRP